MLGSTHHSLSLGQSSLPGQARHRGMSALTSGEYGPPNTSDGNSSTSASESCTVSKGKTLSVRLAPLVRTLAPARASINLNTNIMSSVRGRSCAVSFSIPGNLDLPVVLWPWFCLITLLFGQGSDVSVPERCRKMQLCPTLNLGKSTIGRPLALSWYFLSLCYPSRTKAKRRQHFNGP